jgi:hypothetical protein
MEPGRLEAKEFEAMLKALTGVGGSFVVLLFHVRLFH